MPALQQSVMQALYNGNIWDGFEPGVGEQIPQGWHGNHPSLKRLASTPGEKVVIDVGVWKGQSTITMANAMKEAQIDGCVIAVDTFLGSREHWSGALSLFQRKHGLPDLYQTFMTNVYNAGLQDYVVPMPQTSVTAALILQRSGIKASVIHIDAAHEYEEVLRDAEEYWKVLNSGGFVIGDDYGPSWPGVVRAAGEFSAQMIRPLTIESPKWIMQKP